MNIKGFITKHAPTILSGLACIGVAVTAVLTHRAAIKAQATVKEWTEEKHEELTAFEKAQASVRHYIAPVVAGVVTIGCIVKAQSVNQKDIARLTAVSGIVGGAYEKYRRTNIQVNGKEADTRVIKELNAQKAEYSNIVAESLGTLYSLNSAMDTQERLFYDSITKQYFTSTLSRVIDAEYHLNRNFVQGHPEVDVKMWCDFLGIKCPKDDNRGWVLVDDLTWLDFTNTDPTAYTDVSEYDDPQPIVIEPCVMPVDGYQDLDWGYEYF
jgi:hypothetical protein